MDGNSDSLTQVAEKLRAENDTVIVDGSSLTVMLPMFCSVQVQKNSAGIELLPKFGRVGRVTAIAITILVIVVLIMLAVDEPFSRAEGQLVIVLAVGAIFWDVRRWFITQQAMSRIRRMLAECERA